MKSCFSMLKPCSLFLILYFLIVIGYGICSYYSAKTQTLNSIDEKMIWISSGIKRSLSKDFHDRALNQDSISSIEDGNNVLSLSDYVRKNDVMGKGMINVYTLVKKDGKLFYTSSSKSEKELAIAIETPYFSPYSDASPEVFKAFDRPDQTFITESSKAGSKRKLLIPETSPSGKPYLTGIDIDMVNIEKKLTKNLFRSLAISAIFIILAIPFIFLFRKNEKEHIEEFESLKELLHQKSMHRTTKIEEKINEYINKK